ncbi:hypothetical protein Dcar01_03105 [Deinococcus carri]|uniref:Uncharacterized protein n=1 Tax=Deinococcus carri TaxID=1211323 RepID=A0ABP9WAH8_9DEIO
MSWLKRLWTREPPEPEEVPEVYGRPWEVVQAFLHDPKYAVTILEERAGWVKFIYDGLTAEALDDPEDDWLQIRFRLPFTDEQKARTWAAYHGWTDYCARFTQFHYDIDFEEQEYLADGLAYIHGQYNQVECIRLIFNSAKLFYENSNWIALDRKSDVYVGGKRLPSVALALWTWLSGPLAPPGTKLEHGGYKEETYWMGSALCSVMQEQWLYYALLRFGAGDYVKYMQQDEEMQLLLFKLHLDIQRKYPRVRNFVALTQDPKTNGTHEMSMVITLSHGTNAVPIFEYCLKEVYNALIDYTEWFHFDFNPQTAPWFDHSVKKPQPGIQPTHKETP